MRSKKWTVSAAGLVKLKSRADFPLSLSECLCVQFGSGGFCCHLHPDQVEPVSVVHATALVAAAQRSKRTGAAHACN